MNVSKKVSCTLSLALGTLVITTLQLSFGIAHADVTADNIFRSTYVKYDKKHECWFGDDPASGQRYCMKLDRIDKVQTKTGFRFYMLAVGDAVDETGSPNGGHPTPGAIGAFVVENRNDAIVLIASDPLYPLGTSGDAPRKWELLKLGPDDYWGWENTWGDCHQGYCGSRYAVLAPYGKKIRDLAGFMASYDDDGACIDQQCTNNASSLDSKMRINSSLDTVKVFPVEITVTGKDAGKEVPLKTWTMQFDPKTWRYLEPVNWPLKERDF